MRIRLAMFAALVTLLVYWLAWSGLPHAVDEMSSLSVTESLAAGDGFAVDQMEWDQVRTPPRNAPGTDGALYSKKGIGVSLVALPLWVTGRLFEGGTWQGFAAPGAIRMALLTGPLLAALAVAAMVYAALALGYRKPTALWAGLALGLGTLVLPYSDTLFSEGLAAAGLALALAGAMGIRNGDSLGPAAAMGVGLALVTLAKSSNAVIAPFFFIYAWHVERTRRGDRPRNVLALLATAAIPLGLAVAGTVAYNLTRFGTLLGFPLEAYERFSTPLMTGPTGLLLSPGKGLMWYVPLAWLSLICAIIVIVRAPSKGLRRSDALLALAAIVAPIIFYALWYDWPGGRSWGPRMVAWVCPALVVLALPALDTMTDRRRSGLLRAGVGLVLALSIVAQIPGVLVNFEAQEALDMKAGATFDDLVWKWRLSPLLTYWRAIGASAWEPLLAQPFFRMQRGAMAVITGLLMTALFSISRSWSWAERGRLYGSRQVTLGIDLIALPTTMIMRSGQDPRWEDRSANLADNQQVASTLNAVARGDMVIFDLEEGRAIQSRAWWRANTMPSPALFVGWLRKEVLSAEDDAFLQRTVQKRPRTWLVLQETVEGDPDSTTERWLDANAYRGRSEWIGAQRIVEYVRPEIKAVALGSPVSFGEEELRRFRVLQGETADEWGVELTWTPPLSSDLRFSLQGLDEAGSVVAQVDRAPGSLDGAHDRIGLSAPGAQRLILKLYRASDGAVLPVAGSDSLTLWPAGQ